MHVSFEYLIILVAGDLKKLELNFKNVKSVNSDKKIINSNKLTS